MPSSTTAITAIEIAPTIGATPSSTNGRMRLRYMPRASSSTIAIGGSSRSGHASPSAIGAWPGQRIVHRTAADSSRKSLIGRVSIQPGPSSSHAIRDGAHRPGARTRQ